MFWSDLINFQKEIDQFFNNRSSVFGSNLSSTNFFNSSSSFPGMNLFEKDDKLILKAELPGFNKKDVAIKINGGQLEISGKRDCCGSEKDKCKDKCDNLSYHRQERVSGTFERKFQLPYKIDAEKVRAEFENGILNVEMEKAKEEKGRLIEIR